ncbi:putative invertase inhibitor [Nymphaea thermarum]|nr:putative invertase inhibitor [Nymphaea thermarum]
MAGSHVLPLPIAVFLVLSFGVAPSASTNNADLLHQVCSNVTFKDLCISALGSDPSSSTADINKLAVLSVEVAKEHAKATYSYIEHLLNSTAGDPSLQQSLTDCSDVYVDIVEQLEDSISAFSEKQYKNINTWVSAAISDVQTCDDGFKEQRVERSPLVQKNAITSNLCSNVLAILKMLG